MNGRVYDYNLGRFLSVDPFIQAPGNSQSMNPYSYIMNNPLAGVDPSGYIVKGDPWIEGHAGEAVDDVMKRVNQTCGPNGIFCLNSGSGSQKDNGENNIGEKDGGVAVENIVAIAAYNEKGSERGTFHGRAVRTGATKVYEVHNGKEFVEALVDASKESPITKLYVSSHSGNTAIFMNSNEGLYTSEFQGLATISILDGEISNAGENSATISDVEEKIDLGEIRFADHSEVRFLGCLTAEHPLSPVFDSFAEQFSEVTPQSTVIGSTGYSVPEIKTNSKGRRYETGAYFSFINKYNRDVPGVWKTFKDGKVINQSKDNKLEKE